jgi:hypothetical protein
MRHTLPSPYVATGQATQAVRVQAYDASEHMLRRKTPNGTLAAGYDGSAIQNSTVPPASKQIVLPASSPSFIEISSRHNDSLDSFCSERGTQSLDWYQQSLGQNQHTRLLQAIPDGGADDWKRLPPLINGSATILDRVPMNQDPTFLTYDGNGMQVPTVLQPPYQPCLGPTASNDTGFYGAYWPDGTFEPFRAAPTRDMGFCDITQSDGLYTGYNSTPHNQSEIYRRSSTQAYSGLTFNHCQPSGQAAGVNTQSHPLHVEKPMYAREALVKGDSSAVISFPPQSLYTPTLHTVGKHENAQFKEKVLSWAHNVYADLLALLHHSKKGQHQPRRVHTLYQTYYQTSLYPKPPRQSTANLIGGVPENEYIRLETKHPRLPTRSIHSAGPAPEGRCSSHTVASQLEQLSSVGGSVLRRRSYAADNYLPAMGQENGKVGTGTFLL